MTSKKTQGNRTGPPLRVDSLYGQAAQTIHNHAPIYIGCAPSDQHHQQAQSQADFKKLTGIWCPVEAQTGWQMLRGQSDSPLDVWLAWRFGYIEWNDAKARLDYAVNWLHMTAGCGFFIGLGYALYYLVPVGLANAPTARWVAVFAYMATQTILLLIGLELMVLRPWKVARRVRLASLAEKSDKRKKA